MSGPKSLIGAQAPVVTLPSATGEEFELDPGTAGRPTVIFFFPAAGTYGMLVGLNNHWLRVF